MRMLMTARLDNQRFNDLARAGKMGETLSRLVESAQPEAAYFGVDEGMRTAYLIVNMADNSDMPRLGEPWFLAFDAEIDFRPVMVADDIKKAMPDIEAAFDHFG